MKKYLFSFVILILLCNITFAQEGSEGIKTWVEEEDASPSVIGYKIKFPNGTITDNGDGTASYTPGAGAPHDPVTVTDSTTIDLTLVGQDVKADGLYTAGDALTLTGADFDFDGGASPGGDLGGTWASPSVDDDSHNHTTTTISGLVDADMDNDALDPDKLVGDATDDDKVDEDIIEDRFVKNSASDTMTGTLTADGFTLGNDELITFGVETLKFDGTTDNDFELSDDLTLENETPNIRLSDTDANSDDYELYADDNQAYFTDYTDSKILWRFDSGYNAYFPNSANVLFPASGYLNFGTTGGTNGYGFRDNGGTMQVKNSGGSWANFGGGGGPSYWEYTLLPEASVLDDNAPPAITVIESTGTNTPRFRVADFDATTDEIIYWTFVVPSDMAAGNWLADVSWYTNDVGPNETCAWGITVSATTEADADTPAEQAAPTIDYATEDANETEANRLIQTTITISDLDSVAAGDVVTLQFRRDADSTNGTSDDLTSDARLIGVRLRIPRS